MLGSGEGASEAQDLCTVRGCQARRHTLVERRFADAMVVEGQGSVGVRSAGSRKHGDQQGTELQRCHHYANQGFNRGQATRNNSTEGGRDKPGAELSNPTSSGSLTVVIPCISCLR